MDKPAILADLRKQFGEGRSTLYADELALVLGKTRKAIYGLIDRDGLPVPVLAGQGRPCVSIHAIVDWLAGDAVSAGKHAKPAPTPPVAAPKRKRQSMAAYLSTLRGQMDFLSEFYAALEVIEIEEAAREAEPGEGETL